MSEGLHPDAVRLDVLSAKQIVKKLVSEEQRSQAAVVAQTEELSYAAACAADRIRRGGRLIYVGAGTSGRLALLDAAECVPTFGTPHGVVIAVLAGGPQAFLQAAEGAEDDEQAGVAHMDDLALTKDDVVCGIAASGSTPFVLAALERAHATNAMVVLMTGNGVPLHVRDRVRDAVNLIINLDTGPEIISGSTRLKAGTAQKIALNSLSTTVFTLLGKTYGGLMVDVKATNAKLRRRAVRIVRLVAKVSDEDAERLLVEAKWSAKTAIVMSVRSIPAAEAENLLRTHNGHLRAIIGDVDYLTK